MYFGVLTQHRLYMNYEENHNSYIRKSTAESKKIDIEEELG